MFIPTIYIENIKPENKSIEVSSNKLHHLKNVLRIRDDLWHKIYSSPSVEYAVHNRFGDIALETLKKLRKIKLERKLLN